MGPMEAIMGSVMTIFYYAMVMAAVWKLFRVATDLGEIKTLLTEMRRTAAAPSPKPFEPAVPTGAPVAAQAAPTASAPPVFAGPISLESAEALLREIEAESHALAASEPPKTTA